MKLFKITLMMGPCFHERRSEKSRKMKKISPKELKSSIGSWKIDKVMLTGFQKSLRPKLKILKSA